MEVACGLVKVRFGMLDNAHDAARLATAASAALSSPTGM
jgi:hypothetical protein